MRIAIIEIDGITWDILDPLIKNGNLLNFKRLINSGSYGILKSIKPFLSPVIWTSIVSGKKPEKHGVNHFSSTSNSVKCKRLWDIFTEKGYRCGIFGHLLTWPPPQLDCFAVPGFLARGSETIPVELEFIKKLAFDTKSSKTIGIANYFKYCCNSFKHGMTTKTFSKILGYILKTKIKRSSYLDNYYYKRFLGAKLNSEIFKNIHQRTNPDFSIFYTNIIDSCCHSYWKFMEPEKFNDVSKEEIKKYGNIIPEIYKKVDKILGNILKDLSKDTTVFVLSDHGFQAASGSIMGPVCIIQGTKLLELLGLSKSVIATNIGQGLLLRDKTNRPEAQEHITFLLQKLCLKETDSDLFEIETDDSKNIFIRLSRKHYDILQTNSLKGKIVKYGASKVKFDDIINEGDTKISGVHHEDGVLIVKGPNIRSGYHINDSHVLDITPTVLTLKGMPVARDMDGKIITEIFKDEFIQNSSISYIDTYEPDNTKSITYSDAEDEDEIIKQRLIELGYLT